MDVVDVSWFDIVYKILAVAGPLVAIWLGVTGKKVVKEATEFVGRLKTALEDGRITKEEFPILAMEALDVFVAALPWFVRNKFDLSGHVRWHDDGTKEGPVT